MWFKRMVAGWVADAVEDEEQSEDPRVPMSRLVGTGGTSKKAYSDNQCEGDSFKNPLNITLYNATGGRIVKFHSYDRQAGRSSETTYIIPSEDDFESALGKFITLEAMKHTND